MRTNDIRYNSVKIISSLISLFLMLPILFTGEISFYRTLFVFLINCVLDMLFNRTEIYSIFFIIWGLLNRWYATIVCAAAFCFVSPDFYALFGSNIRIINICLFISPVLCVLKEMAELIYISTYEMLLKKKIEKEISI